MAKSFAPISLNLEKLISSEFDNHRGTIAEPICISGCASLSVYAFFLSNATNPVVANKKSLFIFPTDSQAEEFRSLLISYGYASSALILPSFDVSPYSSLYPNPRVSSERMRWIFMATQSQPCCLIATSQSLSQVTLPKSIFQSAHFELRPGNSVGKDFFQNLELLGYRNSPNVEDVGTYAMRGGVFDVFSPAYEYPLRFELFDDQIESIRFFNPITQRSTDETMAATILACKEVLFSQDRASKILSQLQKDCAQRDISTDELEQVLHSLRKSQYFPGSDFLLPLCYDSLASPLDYVSGANCFIFDPQAVFQTSEQALRDLQSEFESSEDQVLRPSHKLLYRNLEGQISILKNVFFLERIHVFEEANNLKQIEYQTRLLPSFQLLSSAKGSLDGEAQQKLSQQLKLFKQQGQTVFIFCSTESQAMRLITVLGKDQFDFKECSQDQRFWYDYVEEQRHNHRLLHIILGNASESIQLPRESLVFLREQEIFGFKKREAKSAQQEFHQKASALSFGDLKVGDKVVHIQHGVATYEGLKMMAVSGIAGEFLQLSYHGGDKLYLPIYRIGQIQKFSGLGGLDRLGGKGWETTKLKVRHHLRDVASELLSLYAKRALVQRLPFHAFDDEQRAFEDVFAYEETPDQLKTISEIHKDMNQEKPMDRLVCGDVGFGKTEIAMRAAFRCVHSGSQVAVLVPTTVLCMQHLDSFKKRFKDWPIKIASLSRTNSVKETRQVLADLKAGQLDVVIGTHRLLSADVEFHKLGLLIVDEEHRFGVTHKEKIKKIKTSVDTLALSATPIPRTLNMALMGLRDLSLLNTAPLDRLPIKTYIYKYNTEIIRKAVMAEVSRGGQIYFLHNRVDSIYLLADELRALLPEVRIRVGHGQMKEDELEDVMIAFFKHEFDLLLCTTIIESGVDVTRANTMIINGAQNFGLSQLYQIRGRVGRGKERGYCYLLVPPNHQLDSPQQERLKVIQENTALGSGLVIAQHDLELRGAGNLLGEEQSGDVNAVGYELYMSLLEDALAAAKGEERKLDLPEPEINLRIAAFIPDSYIADIRVRLYFYKSLAEIDGAEDIDKIEASLQDQFGKPPEQVMNLLGVMLIRKVCKDFGVRDISSGTQAIMISFTEKTVISPTHIVQLVFKGPQKYSITPDNRLRIKVDPTSWPDIYQELQKLK